MSITSANAVITITVPNLFPTPQQLQQFSADNIFETDAIDASETAMGVDGKLTAGFVFAPVPWNVILMADSPSNALFEQWYAAQVTAKDTYPASGLVTLLGIGRKFVMNNGFLRSYPTMPAAAKVLQPRRYAIVWNSVVAQVAAAA